MSASNMELMIPAGRILNSNIRPVTDITALAHIMDIFSTWGNQIDYLRGNKGIN